MQTVFNCLCVGCLELSNSLFPEFVQKFSAFVLIFMQVIRRTRAKYTCLCVRMYVARLIPASLM